MSIAKRMLRKGERAVAEVPVEYRQQYGTEPIGSVVVSDQRVIFMYVADGAYTTFAEHQLSSEPFAQYRDNELYAVFIPLPDGDQVADLTSTFISEIETEFGVSYFEEILEEAGDGPNVNPDVCSCERISSNKVLVETENLELGELFDEQEFRLVSCKDCYTVYGRYRRGKKASLTKLFSADWLLGEDAASENIVELGVDEAFAIHHPPGGSIRVQDAVLTLSQIASRSDEVVSTYKHAYQDALCYIRDGEMAGYLSWESHARGPILSQVYVRDGYRGEGIAAALVSGWYDNVCEAEQYFADELTAGGRAVLDSIDHLAVRSGPAQEVFSLTSLAFG